MGAVLKREFLILLRHRAAWVEPVVFFSLVLLLFPLATTTSDDFIVRLAPGALWVAAMLANLLSMERFLRPDYETGVLEQFCLSPRPLSLLLLAKIFVHWLSTGVPISVLAPLYGLLLGLPEQALWVAFLSLLLGTAIITLVSAVGAALVVTLRRSSMLLGLVMLPFYVPPLIFGARAVDFAATGLSSTGLLLILAAILILGLIVFSVLAASALRVVME